MLKKVAILAVATALIGAGRVLSGISAQSDAGSKPSTTQPTSPGTTPRSTAQRPRASSPPARVRRARAHRRRRWRNPWRVSSFGEPAAEDSLAGEDPFVRAAAVEALGNWNGGVVVVDPNTGRVLSIVNQKLVLGSAFTPCSTFKPIVGLAALKEGIITPETEFRLGRRTRMNLTEALAHSNNPYFTRLGLMLGFPRLADYAHAFGLGEKAGDGIPGDVPGRFPSRPPKGIGVGFLASYGIEMQVTLLQMAAAVSAIANGGTLYELQYPRTPEDVTQFKPKVRRQLDDLAPFFPEVKEGLAAAVVYGTARLAYNPDEQIYGKTGTCSEDGARLGWFISYASEAQPRYVVVVLLRGGRLVYGPHAAEIAGRLYHGLHRREESASTQSSQLTSSVGSSRGR